MKSLSFARSENVVVVVVDIVVVVVVDIVVVVVVDIVVVVEDDINNYIALDTNRQDKMSCDKIRSYLLHYKI